MWILLIGLVTLLFVLIHYLNKDYDLLALCKRIKRIDGGDINELYPEIPGKTIFGNNFDVLSLTPECVHKYMENCYKYSGGRSYIWKFINSSVYNCCRAEEAESILSSQTLLTKGVVYQLLHGFLGTGLLTSTDKKWHKHRKLLTPAFHFNVLQTFTELFKDESQKLVKVLEHFDEKQISLKSIIPKLTLNIICETAMGVKLDNMDGGDIYRKYIQDLEHKILLRSLNPLYYYDIIYKLFGDYKEYVDLLKQVHTFRCEVINRKREEFQTKNTEATDPEENIGSKRRYAMLDTLLNAEAQGLIDHRGICAEVDTFMFEGYDTTSTCLVFTLFNLALYEDIQEKCYEEIRHIDDLQTLTVFDFNQMEYIECVIKETLRLYPSVPVFSRENREDMELNGMRLPIGQQIQIHPFYIHRDPRHFSDPETFDPNRFLPENTIGRHPFAFIPFSAGPRNCIGQKFAMLEMKAVLVSILKNFKLLPVTRREDLIFESGLILRTKQDIVIKVTGRS